MRGGGGGCGAKVYDRVAHGSYVELHRDRSRRLNPDPKSQTLNPKS